MQREHYNQDFMSSDEVLWQKKRRIQKKRWYQMKINKDISVPKEGLLPSSKVVGYDCWQEKNSKGFKKRLKLCPLSLLMIRGRIFLKIEGMIRSRVIKK